jgi:hypothetical protein
MLPLFVNIKFMFPIKEEIVPFINLNLGGTIALGSSLNYRINESDFDGINDLIGAWGEGVKYSNNQRIGGGFYCDFGIGLRWKCVQLGIGLQHQDLKVVSKTNISVGKEYTKTVDKDKFSNNAFYVKLGFAFYQPIYNIALTIMGVRYKSDTHIFFSGIRTTPHR